VRDVIQKLIATEAEAKSMVEAARTEAGRISSEARQQADALLVRARQEARTETGAILAAAAQQAEREKQEQMAHATLEMESELRFDESTRERAVKAALLCVCGQL